MGQETKDRATSDEGRPTPKNSEVSDQRNNNDMKALLEAVTNMRSMLMKANDFHAKHDKQET